MPELTAAPYEFGEILRKLRNMYKVLNDCFQVKFGYLPCFE